jgi:hypothetical protein
MRWRTLLMTIILAAICSGGTFTCHSHSDHHDATLTD